MEKNITRYGITIEVDAKGPTIYIVEHTIDEVCEILLNDCLLLDEVRWKVVELLKKVKQYNAILREIRGVPEPGKMRISFETESWEDFLGLKNEMEELSQ